MCVCSEGAIAIHMACGKGSMSCCVALLHVCMCVYSCVCVCMCVCVRACLGIGGIKDCVSMCQYVSVFVLPSTRELWGMETSAASNAALHAVLERKPHAYC